MTMRTTLRTVGLAGVVAAAPALLAIAVHAQTPSPSTAPAAGAVKVAPPAAARDAAAAVRSTTKDVAVGASVVGSDGQKIGEVKGVKSDPAGLVEEIHVKTGSLLGFGGRVVVIPAAKIAKGGATVQLAMTASDIGKLPPLAEKKG